MKFCTALGFVIVTLLAGVCAADEIASKGVGEFSAKKIKTLEGGQDPEKVPFPFSINYPESWIVTDASEARGSVSKIASPDNYGVDSLAIYVVPASTRIKGRTAEEVFTPEFLTRYSVPGATMVRKERLKEGNVDGAIFEYEFIRNQLRVFVTNYTILYKDCLVQFQFYVRLAQPANKESDEARVAAFRPLWKEMLDSLQLK